MILMTTPALPVHVAMSKAASVFNFTHPSSGRLHIAVALGLFVLNGIFREARSCSNEEI
jgi:hypothetical protein